MDDSLAEARLGRSGLRNSVALSAIRKFKTSAKRLRKKKKVTYDTASHLSVLFQTYGSVWGTIFPYCIANVLITLFVYCLRGYGGIDITIHSTGHKFLAVLVSFFIIGSAQITLNRYMVARAHLQQVHQSAIDLVSMSSLLTFHDKSSAAQEYRYLVVYHTIVCVVGVTAAIEFLSTGHNLWDIKDLPKAVRDDIKKYVMRKYKPGQKILVDENAQGKVYFKGKQRNMLGLNLQVPIALELDLRLAITSHRKKLIFQRPMHVNEEREILKHVSMMDAAFHGMKELVQTPIPFPLVQMRRVILFFWIFTLPVCLMTDIIRLFPLCMIIFFITAGFFGLEVVVMEIEDPFGNDPNDFDDVGMTQVTALLLCDILRQTDGNIRGLKVLSEFEEFFRGKSTQSFISVKDT